MALRSLKLIWPYVYFYSSRSSINPLFLQPLVNSPVSFDFQSASVLRLKYSISLQFLMLTLLSILWWYVFYNIYYALYSNTISQTAGKAIWNVNNISYLPPKVPTLSKVLAGATTAASFNATENTFILPARKTIQITFPPT